MPASHHVFISYASKDPTEWVQAVAKAVQSAGLTLWSDNLIRTGDRWSGPILAAIDEAPAAILVLSAKFFRSKFIKTNELPRMLERERRGGLRIFPLLLEDCDWQKQKWLTSEQQGIQFKRGQRPFGELGEDARREALHAAVQELVELMVDDQAERISVALLKSALLQDELPEKEAHELARAIARQLKERLSYLDAKASLVDATRFCIEYHLLCEEELGPIRLYRAVECLNGSRPLYLTEEEKNGLDEFERKVREGDFSLKVKGKFFSRTREREHHWQRYFNALDAASACSCKRAALGKPCLPFCPTKLLVFSRDDSASLAKVRVVGGFVAPQYLVAGLLSRFNDDWRPVLDKYSNAAGGGMRHQDSDEATSLASERRQLSRRTRFNSVQATQWTCWLVWGPSIPLCTCENWKGAIAYQYGLGDENNSIPIYERWRPTDPEGLIEHSLGKPTDVVRAYAIDLTGRLRWAPYLLRLDPELVPPPAERDDDEVTAEQPDPAQDRRAHGAIAQRTLFEGGNAHTSADHSDGLVFSVSEATQIRERDYFSAYLWIMFLVRRKASGSDRNKVVRLGGGPLDRLPKQLGLQQIQGAMRDQQVWRDLLPVFIHANIADPRAFEVQRGILIECCMQMLRSLWDDPDAFDPEDREAGIEFEVVSASDYTGCGCPVLYPAKTSLIELLRQRLEREVAQRPQDKLAEAVKIPTTTQVDPSRPMSLRIYYSACHLPDLVGAFYEGVRPNSGAKKLASMPRA